MASLTKQPQLVMLPTQIQFRFMHSGDGGTLLLIETSLHGRCRRSRMGHYDRSAVYRFHREWKSAAWISVIQRLKVLPLTSSSISRLHPTLPTGAILCDPTH